jgi:hypothetical protein
MSETLKNSQYEAPKRIAYADLSILDEKRLDFEEEIKHLLEMNPATMPQDIMFYFQTQIFHKVLVDGEFMRDVLSDDAMAYLNDILRDYRNGAGSEDTADRLVQAFCHIIRAVQKMHQARLQDAQRNDDVQEIIDEGLEKLEDILGDDNSSTPPINDNNKPKAGGDDNDPPSKEYERRVFTPEKLDGGKLEKDYYELLNVLNRLKRVFRENKPAKIPYKLWYDYSSPYNYTDFPVARQIGFNGRSEDVNLWARNAAIFEEIQRLSELVYAPEWERRNIS